MPSREAARAILTRDTSRDAEARQVEIWQAMSTVERLALVNGASRAARVLALAGLRERYPHASDLELVARLARLTLGEALAIEVYPEFAHLDP